MTDQLRCERFRPRKRPEPTAIWVLLVIIFAIAIPSHWRLVAANAPAYKLVGSLAFKTASKTTPWYIAAYQADVTDLTMVEAPAKLCFARGAAEPPQSCVMAEAHQGAARYAFQTVESLSVERVLNDGETAVLFVTRFSGGGSGALRLISLWGEGGAPTGLTRMLFQVVSEQGEHAALPVTKNGHRGVFVTADYRLSPGETHFSPHHFSVRIFRLDPKRRTFINVETYTTTRKYPSLDDVDNIEVIRYEMPEIERRLDQIKQ